MQRQINLVIDENLQGKRADVAIATLIPEVSRARIQRWIKDGSLLINQKPIINKQKVYLGDVVTGEIEEQIEIEAVGENIPLDIVYEDEHILIINKPIGLVVHPGAGNPTGTLMNALLYHNDNLKTIPRAGIVHRLDKDTSGVMVVAKTIEAQYDLVKQLQTRSVKRSYIALVLGDIISGGTVTANIGRSGNDRLKMSVTVGGKEAITHYRVKQRYKGLTLLTCSLETGRTHQIRVHMTHIKHPLIGDKLYKTGNRVPKGLDEDTRDLILNFPHQALHAKSLTLIHPFTKKQCTFNTKLTEEFKDLLSGISHLAIDEYKDFDDNYIDDDNFEYVDQSSYQDLDLEQDMEENVDDFDFDAEE